MRCPNCGNENPPDYVFCDECGARLQGGDDTGIAAQAATANVGAAGQTQESGVAQDGGGGQAQQGYGVDTGYGSSPGGQAQEQSYPGQQVGQHDGGQYAPPSGDAGFDSGPMGATGTGPGDDPSSWGTQGGTDTGTDRGAGAGAAVDGAGAGGDGGYGSVQQATQATYGEDKGFGAGQSATSGTGVPAPGAYAVDQEPGASIPLTEDTMQMGGQEDQDWQPGADDSDLYAPTQAGDDQGPSMPGIVAMDEAGAQGDQEAAGYASIASGESYSDAGAGAGAGAQAGGQGQGAWASQALNLLDRAQSALGRGDWAAFGAGMSELRSFLAGLGAAPSPAAWTTGSAGSYDAISPAGATGSSQGASLSSGAGQASGYTGSDAPAGQSASYSGYNEPAHAGGASQGVGGGTPAVEPQAEAGTLDAEAHTALATDYGTPSSGAAGGTGVGQDSAMAATDATTDSTAGAGVGMMSPAASQAAVGGVAASTNGASDSTMARLVIISTGAELPLPDQEEIMVGREDPSSGIFPDVDLTPYGGEEGGVSRRHARLLHISGDYFVEDLQSTNFTKLDGQRLPAHVRERLEDGARIDFGRVATIFRRS